jgi:hypothetical protein
MVVDHHGRDAFHCANITAATLRARDAALIGPATAGGGGRDGIQRQATGDQGMRLRGAAVVRQRRLQNIREENAGRRDDISWARTEALYTGVAIHAKEVVVVGLDSSIIGRVEKNLRSRRSSIP